MIFTETGLKGAFVIEPELKRDDRGFFARTWCLREFERHGLSTRLVQCNVSFNRKRGALRGMHYQVRPHAETKTVRCTAGAVFDVILDLRPDSPTFLEWRAVELTSSNYRTLYVPEGFAHGFQAISDNTEIFYQMSEFYEAGSARGFRYDDPKFRIDWPLPVSEISNQDLAWPSFGSV